MSCTFPLPLECLQLIVHHLTAQQARKSVAALLCVNKYVCGATLPILYRDPFVDMAPFATISTRATATSFAFGPIDMTNKTVLGLIHLVRVLLLSMPPSAPCDDQDDHDGKRELVTELVRVAFFQDQKRDQDQHDDKAALSPPLLPTPFLPYYSFVTTVSFEDTSHSTGGLLSNGLLAKEPAVQNFMERTGRAARALAQEPFRRFRWGNVEKTVVSDVTELQLRQDLTWALCFSNAECIQTLYISIADIGRYMTLMPRLKVLSEVNFQLDRDTTMQLQPEHEYTLEERTLLARLEEDRRRQLEEMISFVKEHQRHHPKSIRTARCLNDRAPQDSCPDEYYCRLLQSLPPLNQPRCLNHNNWAQFAANVADTDLCCVKSIQYQIYGREIRFLSHLLEQRPFLQRCRSLEKISIASFGEDMFKWAVQERKDFDESKEAAPSRRSLIPLREYQIQFPNPSFGRQVDDVAYAFQDTLETMIISGFCPHDFNIDQSWPEFLLGTGDSNEADVDSLPSWPELPRLNVLCVYTTWIYLRVHRHLLKMLPRLSTLTLDDKRSRYNLADVVHWEPAELPDLTHLSLTGTAAISFHPDTFKSTRNLYSLDLRMEYHDAYSFIPHPEQFDQTPANSSGESADEHGDDDDDDDDNDNSFSIPSPQRRRPVWTWDWDLPKLTHLCLTSEFAYRFQFRMLAGTPSLLYFTLDINSFSRLHKRTVGIADLVKPGFQHPELQRFLEQERQQQEKKRTQERRRDRFDLDYGEQEEEEEVEGDELDGNGGDDEEQSGSQDDEIWQEFEFVNLTGLEDFLLAGPWMLDYRVLSALFGKVAPKMERVRLKECYGFSVSEFVKSTSENLHKLQEAVVTIPWTDKLVAEAGLVEHTPGDAYRGNIYQLERHPVGRSWSHPAKYEFGRSDYDTLPIDLR
ncbi:hypothetical protein EC957_007838 [Mortierella hygrophila]|uniref:Uncharacterized protein n=1 Tax=Mortierella hygrophila TaxID=979708 RepID=A0A9P6JXU6_9FUNG|nr:hypothetical protein EC957_007838 [Mortierella hygrophila]